MDKKEDKFNFSEEEEAIKKDQAVEQSKQAVKQDAKGLWQSTNTFLVELLDFRHDTDRDATIDAIKGDVAFKGATAWILVCSIMVASVGLNANSTAVVIGAMLISPLMGPILGVGMAIAINDIDTLRKSLINLAVMIVLSLLTAFLFFWLFPLSEETSELLGRVKPDIRDVLIAFFGGLALIIARTKKGTIASVIFGVAIATALMPPLCTAGYGLAEGNWSYFLGAMYLFTINTIFIALATFMVLKLLRFPMLRYANSKKRRRISQLASLLAIIVMIPAGWTFWNVLNKSGYERDYNNFIKNEIETNRELWFQSGNWNEESKTITLYFNGEIAEATEADLRNELKAYEKLSNFELKISGNKNRSYDKIVDAYDRAINELDKKETIIVGLQQQLINLREELDKANKQHNTISFSNLSRDAKIRFNDLQYFGYSKMLTSNNFTSIDTVDVISTKWNETFTDSVIQIKDRQLMDWVKTQIQSDSIVLKKNN